MWHANDRRQPGFGRRSRSGWTLIELLAVIILASIVLLIGSLSVYRGKAMSEQLACQDNMRAIHSALQIYWQKNRDPITNAHIYPVSQAAFEQFLRSTTYFPDGELHCPQDSDRSRHYQYGYTPKPSPVPSDVVLSCPVTGSDHGSN